MIVVIFDRYCIVFEGMEGIKMKKVVKNERERKLCLSFVIGVIVLLFIGCYAIYSHTEDGIFDDEGVYFSNVVKKTEGMVDIGEPTVQGSSFQTLSGTFKTPLDRVEVEFDIVNSSSKDMELKGITMSNPICEGVGEKAERDANYACDCLIYSIKYNDGEGLKIGDSIPKRSKKHAIMMIYFKDQMESFYGSKVEIGNINFKLSYEEK